MRKKAKEENNQEKNTFIKLIINTLYGIIASKDKSVNNVILANNVTAIARCEIWKYSRALRGYQCITDGFSYSPDKIYEINMDSISKRGLPGLNSLSDLTKLQDHRSIKLVTLNNRKDWEEIIKSNNIEVLNEIDKLATDHINKFLSNYGLKMRLQIEHKPENTATSMLYFKKAHNIRIDLLGKITIKIRGFKADQETILKQNYIKSLQDPTTKINDLEYEITEMNTINDYLTNKNLIPGNLRKEKHTMKYTLLDHTFQNAEIKKQVEKQNIDIIKKLQETNLPITMQNIQIYKQKIINEIDSTEPH